MSEKTFRELEHQGWVQKAAVYRDVFGKITEQAIDPILNSFGDLTGRRFLDVACGTGELAAAAVKRGAHAEGLDFAATMVAKASAIHPDARFKEGDAEQLPYPINTFDAVSCSFGLAPPSARDRVYKKLQAGIVWTNAQSGIGR